MGGLGSGPRRGPAFTCEWCHQSFWRPKKPAAIDARRFCSKRCAAFKRTAAGLMPFQQVEVQVRLAIATEHRRQQQREERDRREQERKQQRLDRQQEYQETTKCACGAPSTITRWNQSHPYVRRWCAACHAQEFQAWRHVCPDCGQEFYGAERDTYCSPRCQHRYTRKGRYPFLGAIPVAERNRLAALIVLVRQARRQINTEVQIPLYP
jgi:hypothetical protein